MRIRTSVFLSFIVGAGLCVSAASAGEHPEGELDGLQQVPPNASPGTGVGQCLIDVNTNTLFFHVSFSGLVGVETVSHIHGAAPPGSNAGVKFGLPLGSPKIGAWTYAAADEADILAGLMYFNIHSTVSPGGEIRGQIVPQPSTDFVTLINGLQPVPPTGSPGLGIGTFDVDTVANTMAYEIRFGNLVGVETVAHIHGPAPPGANAGVQVSLPVGDPKLGSTAFTEAQEAQLLGGLWYVNIHSTANPGGEIRGQILKPSPVTGVDSVPLDRGGFHLLAAPNPAPHGNVALFYRVPEAGMVTVTIHDVSGRMIRTLHDRESAPEGVLAWDTRDEAGRSVAAGVYFARAAQGAVSETRRIVILR